MITLNTYNYTPNTYRSNIAFKSVPCEQQVAKNVSEKAAVTTTQKSNSAIKFLREFFSTIFSKRRHIGTPDQFVLSTTIPY